MAPVDETPLPGVGVRYEFTTRSGDQLGVIAHRNGERELLVYDRADPDSCRVTLGLADDDARTLVDLLGGSEVSERLDVALRQSIAGLVLEWVQIEAGASSAGVALSELGLRTRTGASVVAVVRGDESILSPKADFALRAGDTAVLVGAPPAVAEAAALLKSG